MAGINIAKSFAPVNTGKMKNPTEKIRAAMTTRKAAKFEKEIEAILAKPAAERTFNEKMELAYYNTAKGLLDIKNYPPVKY